MRREPACQAPAQTRAAQQERPFLVADSAGHTVPSWFVATPEAQHRDGQRLSSVEVLVVGQSQHDFA